MSDLTAQLIAEITALKARLAHLEGLEQVRFVPLSAALTSVSWDGDPHSDAAKALIDLSAVFGAPAGIKAVLFDIVLNDSGSAAAGSSIILDDTNTADVGAVATCTGIPNDIAHYEQLVVPCDANGDVYIQIYASGVNTLDVSLSISGYWI